MRSLVSLEASFFKALLDRVNIDAKSINYTRSS